MRIGATSRPKPQTKTFNHGFHRWTRMGSPYPCSSVVKSLFVHPPGGPETGPALRARRTCRAVAHSAKADKQPREPGHGVVQTGSPPKRPGPLPFKEQSPSATAATIPQKLHYASEFLPRMDTDAHGFKIPLPRGFAHAKTQRREEKSC